MDSHEMKLHNSEMIPMRNSGVELLKIIGMFAIIINHMTQSVSSINYHMDTTDYVIDLWTATTDIHTLLLIIFRSFGSFGNSIFFISTAWFLCESKQVKTKKCFSILLDVWIISVIWLIVMVILRSGDIAPAYIIRSLLPNLFGNNWYLTCYLIFYPLHPLLNILISHFDKRTHFRVVSGLGIPFLLINSIKEDLLYATNLTTWIALYFLISYIKKYHYEDIMKKKMSFLLIAIGIAGYLFEVLITDFIGFHIGELKHQMLHWGKNSNPFIIITALGLFVVFMKHGYRSKIINYISSLMMLVFVIHENIVFSAYTRPLYYVFIYNNFGYGIICLWVIIGSLGVYGISLILAAVYDKTLRKVSHKLSDLLCGFLTTIYIKIEKKLIKA